MIYVVVLAIVGAWAYILYTGRPSKAGDVWGLMIGALLLTAGAVSGRLKRRGPRYLTAPAVVTAIEPLRSGDEPAWRIKFAYFDSKGDAHEATDEVVAATWKAGDEGVAVFPTDRPELATFRPLETA